MEKGYQNQSRATMQRAGCTYARFTACLYYLATSCDIIGSRHFTGYSTLDSIVEKSWQPVRIDQFRIFFSFALLKIGK